MILLAPVLAIPIFALQLGILHLATLAHPLRRQPLLTLSIDSLGIGVIVAAELIDKWAALIDAELAASDHRPARERSLPRITTVLTGAALTALMLRGLWWAIDR